MRVFKEIQKFDQWWIKLLLGVLLIGSAIALYRNYTAGSGVGETVFGFVVILLVCFLFIVAKLETRIDQKGITAAFSPAFIFTRKYSWAEMEKVYVRKYAPVREYGGWGIRGFGKASAYNTSGDEGIQIVSKKGERFLIGTHQPEDAKKVIARYTKNSEI
ncbi:hypothetical protein [Gramella sp. AN32]|uniref:PH domain-containing protein n=1 Tax=Christiangramia antarctica TaxID=2058158 RepID=A0ABW5X7B2_9FLAO|nr:hypothetical protein [Gramella sp. AN32]MCM4154619.1 hypothetical protein [Gramella sp. AN32]